MQNKLQSGINYGNIIYISAIPCGMKGPRAAGLDINKEENMSTDRWAYSPEKCEGQTCPGDCDFCPLKDEEDEEVQEILNARRGEE